MLSVVAADVLDVLADPTRRRLVELLNEQAHSVGELAAQVGMSAAATSRHLRILRDASFVHAEISDRDARVHVYRLDRAPLAALRAWLDQMDAFWSEQLESFRQHAARLGGTGATPP